MPAEVTNLILTESASSVNIAWDAVPVVDGYRIYRKPLGAAESSYSLVFDTTEISVDDQTPNYDMSDLNAGPTLAAYDYKVTTYAGANESVGVEDSVTMVDITTGEITGIGLLDTPYREGGVDKTIGYSVSNPDTETAIVNDTTKTAHENRLRGVSAYQDET